MSKTPSAILSDALTSFNKAATLAFAAAQDQARKDVTHATADARDARRERDDAVNALHAARAEEQARKEEASAWKAAANQAELTIDHHLETIAQLREEATQWKNQCLRLEETSRQEAVSWKEQFLRVEQERLKLAQRVEELLAEQLSTVGHGQPSTTPYTPVQKHSSANNLSASTRLQRLPADDFARTGPLVKHTPSVSKSTSNTSRNRTRPNTQLPTPISENQRSARQRATQEIATPVSHSGPTSNGSRQTVIRRVKAVVEIPVKEESVEPENVVADTRVSAITSSVASTSTSAPKHARVTKTSKAPSRIIRRVSVKRPYVEIDDASDHDVSDGDDELLMGSEASRKKRVRQSTDIQSPSPVRTVIKSKRRQVLDHVRPILLPRS